MDYEGKESEDEVIDASDTDYLQNSQSETDFEFQSESQPQPESQPQYSSQIQSNISVPSNSAVPVKNNMATASMAVGIISIVTSCCCCGGLIFGGLGILFALLSKTGEKLDSNAKIGLITSIIGLVLSLLLCLIFIVVVAIGSFSMGGNREFLGMAAPLWMKVSGGVL